MAIRTSLVYATRLWYDFYVEELSNKTESIKKFLGFLVVIVLLAGLFYTAGRLRLNNYYVYVIDATGKPIEGASVKVYYSPLSDFPEGGSNSSVTEITDLKGIATIGLPNIILGSTIYCAKKTGYFNFRNPFYLKPPGSNPQITLKRKEDVFVVRYSSEPFSFDQPQKLPSWNELKRTSIQKRNFSANDCDQLEFVQFVDNSYLATNSVNNLNDSPDFIVRKTSRTAWGTEMEIEALGENKIKISDGSRDLINVPISLDGFQKKIELKESSAIHFFIISTPDGRIFGGTIGTSDRGKVQMWGYFVSSTGVAP